MNKNKNKLLSFFIISVFCSISFITGISSGLESIGKNITWPTEKTTRITSKFGYRPNPIIGGKMHFHNGLDIGAPPGEKLIAIESGRVILAEFYGGYGFTVIIEGNITKNKYLYGHVDENLLVKKDMEVNIGDVIAKVGKYNVSYSKGNPYKDKNGKPINGFTTGPHLHFSVIKDGKFIDPLEFLNTKK